MQQIAVVTLGTKDRQAARRFYLDGFAWNPGWRIDAEDRVTFGI